MSNKVKVLLVGAIGDSVEDFCRKISSLQKSKAGPFDVCFCVGPVNVALLQGASSQLPLPVYVQGDNDDDDDDDDDDNKRGVVELATNLYALRGADVWSLDVSKNKRNTLVVASCPPRVRLDAAAARPFLDKVSHVSYVGCDIFLSAEWPQGVEHVLPNNNNNNTTANNKKNPVGSYDVAELALRARPRYHVAPHTEHVQSLPFGHLASGGSSSTHYRPKHVGRFLTLAPVATTTTTKKTTDKSKKIVHALGLTPLASMTAEELETSSSTAAHQLQPCPYTDASYEMDSAGGGAGGGAKQQQTQKPSTISTSTSVGLSEAQARRILSESSSSQGGGDTHTRWQQSSSSKKRPAAAVQYANSEFQQQQQQQHDNDDDTVDPNNNNTTLFLHGLHKDVRGRLQTATGALLQAFAKFQVQRVRRPPSSSSSSYAFLEFASHEAARTCLEELGGQAVVEGIHLTLKWATTNNTSSSSSSNKKRRRLTEAEAADSSTLYFRLPQPNSSSSSSSNNNNNNNNMTISETKTTTDSSSYDHDQAFEDVRKLMERTLEHALGNDVTAETEPALQVKVRGVPEQQQDQQQDHKKKKNFGFLEFASHAAASMAVASLTNSTDGGLLKATAAADVPSDLIPQHLIGLALHWAHDAVKPQQDSTTTGGLKFQRKHFPKDARTDCWFCLASPTCEKHLITSVHNECYIAMPKGPVDPRGHVLLIPVTHSSKGALVDRSVANEMEDLKERLRRHASDVWNKDLFVFERAIETKGGYHTHVQCIPVERGLGVKIQATLLGMARSIPGLDLRELNSDLALTAVLSSDDHDQEEKAGGYFYAEVPVSAKESKRFLYKQTTTTTTTTASGRGATVPLQFGREVLATVMENPDLAHWKACVLDQEKETELANEFRSSFAKYLS